MEWYEAHLTLPTEPSSVVRSFKTHRFPPNRKGEVTDEDFELLENNGHIGEGRLQVVDELPADQKKLQDAEESPRLL
jgi:hypothetical protein